MAEDGSVLDNYLIWELCKQKGIHSRIIDGSFEGERLKEIIEEVRQDYQENDYNRAEKIDLMRELDNNPDYRCKIFKDCSWSKEAVKVEDLGTTLPRAGDLPPEVISGSLKEVIDFVREADPEEYRSVKYIESLKEIPEVLNQFFPWVIIPGNRTSKRDRMNKVHGGKDWDIVDTRGMINDGNHRTIAKILAEDLDEIECYVGYRQDQK